MAKKAWLKNGKVIMRDGKVVLCDECPCCPCACWPCGASHGWIKVAISGVADGADRIWTEASNLNGERTVPRDLPWYTDSPTEGGGPFCRWSLYVDAETDYRPDLKYIDVHIEESDGVKTLVAEIGVYDSPAVATFRRVIEDCGDILGAIPLDEFYNLDSMDNEIADFSGAALEITQVGPNECLKDNGLNFGADLGEATHAEINLYVQVNGDPVVWSGNPSGSNLIHEVIVPHFEAIYQAGYNGNPSQATLAGPCTVRIWCNRTDGGDMIGNGSIFNLAIQPTPQSFPMRINGWAWADWFVSESGDALANAQVLATGDQSGYSGGLVLNFTFDDECPNP